MSLKENLHNDNFDSDQIFRRNTFDLNCNRHFKVFNTFNVIPKFCFGCYKILINPKNIIELFSSCCNGTNISIAMAR